MKTFSAIKMSRKVCMGSSLCLFGQLTLSPCFFDCSTNHSVRLLTIVYFSPCIAFLTEQVSATIARRSFYGHFEPSFDNRNQYRQNKSSREGAYNPWGCSSAGRASRSQRGGRGFESHHLHHGNSIGARPQALPRFCIKAKNGFPTALRPLTLDHRKEFPIQLSRRSESE